MNGYRLLATSCGQSDPVSKAHCAGCQGGGGVVTWVQVVQPVGVISVRGQHVHQMSCTQDYF